MINEMQRRYKPDRVTVQAVCSSPASTPPGRVGIPLTCPDLRAPRLAALAWSVDQMRVRTIRIKIIELRLQNAIYLADFRCHPPPLADPSRRAAPLSPDEGSKIGDCVV
jgi:hypothetical protein